MSYRIVALVAVLAGCSRDAGLAAADVEAAAMRGEAAVEQAAAMPVTMAANAPSDDRSTPGAPPAGGTADALAKRMIVRSARLTLQVADVRRGLEQVGTLASDLHGFLGDSRRWSEGGSDRATLTLRVPATSLDAALGRLRRLAVRVDDEALGGEDVTAQAVDLGAQLTNLRATETELRALLVTVRQRTQKASDVLEVHAELSRIRGEIERHAAQLQSLRQLAAMATITIDMRPDAVTVPVVTEGWQPRAVLHAATRALLGTGRMVADGLIWAVVVGVPLLVLVLAAGLVVRPLLRRLRRRGSASTPAALAG